MVRMTDELGEVQTAYWDAGGLYVAIRINGESGVYKADDLLTTGMSYEEYVEQELQYDTGVEFDVDHDEEETPPLAPPRCGRINALRRGRETKTPPCGWGPLAGERKPAAP